MLERSSAKKRRPARLAAGSFNLIKACPDFTVELESPHSEEDDEWETTRKVKDMRRANSRFSEAVANVDLSSKTL